MIYGIVALFLIIFVCVVLMFNYSSVDAKDDAEWEGMGVTPIIPGTKKVKTTTTTTQKIKSYNVTTNGKTTKVKVK